MLIESQILCPKSALLRSYIELYRLIQFKEGVSGVTIPNGRLDMTLLLEGEFIATQGGEQVQLPELLAFPLTREGAQHLSIAADSVMINVKLYPHVLTRQALKHIQLNQYTSWTDLFGSKPSGQLLKRLKQQMNDDQWCTSLDAFFEEQLFDDVESKEELVTEAILFIEENLVNEIAWNSFCTRNAMSMRTLERRFKSVTGLTTKIYQDLVKFQQALKRVREGGRYTHGDLLEVLGSGYYDQSHFVKVCRKLTGKSPKKLFSSLPAPLTDFMLLDMPGGMKSTFEASSY